MAQKSRRKNNGGAGKSEVACTENACSKPEPKLEPKLEKPEISEQLEVLKNSNFKICKEIITRSEDGKQIMAYVKCTTPLGQQVYVEVDNIQYSGKEPTMAEVNSLNSMPEEIKKKHFKNVGSGVSGVVIECEHNICVLNRNIEKENPEERNFVYLDPASNKKTLLGDNPDPIPIVKIKDIKASAPESIVMINESTIRARREMNKDGLKGFEATRKALQDIYEELTVFSESIDDKLTNTITVLAGLEDRQKFILESGAAEEESQMMNLINDNAIRFNELIAEENRCITAVNNCAVELNKILNRLKTTNDYLQQKYETTIEALEKSKQEIKY